MSTERGFTFIEVLVSLAIVALALLSLQGAINAMIGDSYVMRERTYASWIAQNKIAEMRLANVLPEVGTSNGQLDYAAAPWEWRAVVSETGIEEFMRVEVSVSRADSDYVIMRVTGFIGRPVGRNVTNSIWTPPRAGGPDRGPTG